MKGKLFLVLLGALLLSFLFVSAADVSCGKSISLDRAQSVSYASQTVTLKSVGGGAAYVDVDGGAVAISSGKYYNFSSKTGTPLQISVLSVASASAKISIGCDSASGSGSGTSSSSLSSSKLASSTLKKSFAPAEGSGGSNSWIVISLIALVVVLFAVYFFYWRKK
ncbi:hypothetical protein HZA98_00010 [Candidatus Woesearchaeota archaeon]|nr:hypothetical protein [Candidatus Woesearchaeota archaeon]